MITWIQYHVTIIQIHNERLIKKGAKVKKKTLLIILEKGDWTKVRIINCEFENVINYKKL